LLKFNKNTLVTFQKRKYVSPEASFQINNFNFKTSSGVLVITAENIHQKTKTIFPKRKISWWFRNFSLIGFTITFRHTALGRTLLNE